jgi:hypothetical protein
MKRIIPALTIMIAIPGTAALAQACNPVIDGTYCASQPGRTAIDPARTARNAPLSPIQGLGGDIAGPRDDPGTLGAITFRSDGAACIGLLRRGNCK